MAKKLKLPMIQAPCSACQQNPKQNEKVIMVACPHNQAVAIMPLKDGEPKGIWRVFTPATPGDVCEILAQR
jgi:hypothetical protein